MRKILSLCLLVCALALVTPAKNAVAADTVPVATQVFALGVAEGISAAPSDPMDGVKLPVPVPEDDALHGLLVNAVKSAQEGNWKLMISAVLFLLMFVVRKVKLPFLQGDRGGAISVMLLALLGAFGSALASGAPISLGLVTGAVTIAFTAVGGYTWVKRVWKPNDKKAPTA